MKRGIRRIIFVVVVIFLLFFIVGANEETVEVDDEVEEKLDNAEEVRVFVNFKEEALIKKRGLFGLRKTGKEKVIEDVGKEKLNFEFEDSVSVYIDKSDLERLKKTSGIESIEPVGVRNLFLQDSVGQINATPSYSLQVNGFNLTGKDRTICILDSGVNYSHPDLGSCWGNNSKDSGCKIWGGKDYCADDSTCTSEDYDPIDVNGHGTHVSGIAAANGTINGVAKGSRIVILKVCNSTGSCFDDAIKSGIDWCVNNASIFNISVISMSLGGGLSAGFCNNDPLAANINDAVGANIPVVIAAGNDDSFTHIAAPACVQNATPVGGIGKDDSTFDFNRNSLVQLIAPGVNINSTYLSATGYTILSGTSMSTPHVAGSIAIISQFLNLTGQSKTPEEIEDALNDSGEAVYDSSSDLNYSRINIYDAILSLDIDAPNVTLISPSNNTNSINRNQTFSCNATDLVFENVTFYLWNSSNSIVNESSRDIDGAFNLFEINITNISDDEYEWNCLYNDEKGNAGFADSNFTLTINEILITLLSPADNIFTNENQTFSCNATSDNALANVTFYLWNSSNSEVNTTFQTITGTSNASDFNFNFTYEDKYGWSCLYANSANSSGFASSNFSLTYDLTNAEINITSPLNDSWHNSGRFNVSLNENGTCVYTLDSGITNVSMSSINDQIFNSTNSSIAQGGVYNVTFYCNDTAGNLNSEDRKFNIDLTVPNVTAINPVTGHSVTGTTSINFDYNVTDNLNITGCDLILNNVSVALNESEITNVTNSITHSVTEGSYTWNINCTDQAGNIGNSSLRSLTVDAAASSTTSSSGGGGGGGGSTTSSVKTFVVNNEDTSDGYTNELKKNDKIIFEIFDEEFKNHTLIIDFIGENFVNLSIVGKDKFILGIGQSIKLNLTSANYYDLLVKLEEIIDKKAKLTIQTIKDPILTEVIEEERTVETEEIDGDKKEVNYAPHIVASIIIVVVLFLIILVRQIMLKRQIKKEVIEELGKKIGKKGLRKKPKEV